MLKRFAGSIYGVSLSTEIVNKMDMGKCIASMQRFIASKKVCVVRIPAFHVTWVEGPLCEWFEAHYLEIGFDRILKERTPEYLLLKEDFGFFGFPDYLVSRNGRWLRLEVECWSEQYKYTHSHNYADILLCYAETVKIDGVETIAYNVVEGYEDIINQYEVGEYLYLNDPDFQKEYDRLMDLSIMQKMGLI